MEKITTSPAPPWSKFCENWAPTLLLGSAGLFGWAIRGCSGFGAIPGCIFAGTLFAMCWYLLAHESSSIKSRRYSLGWTIILLILVIGVSGMQGWMQWPSWIKGELILNADANPNITTPINPFYGYLWFFIVAVHWGGLGAVGIAWTGSKTPLTAKDWVIRLSFGGAGFLIAWLLFILVPQLFLPPAEGISTQDYFDWETYPSLERAVKNNWEATVFLGIFMGFLAYEIMRKDWMNVKLITIVGVVSGIFWMIFQFWRFMGEWFPAVQFNWWRCWESSAGFGIGAAYGIAFSICNKPLPPDHPDQRIQPFSAYPNAERVIGVYGGLIIGLTWSLISGIKGYTNLYYGIDEPLLGWMLPLILVGGGLLLIIAYQTFQNPFTIKDKRDNVPAFLLTFWIVYIVHREIGLQVTGPLTNPSELAFFVYYLILTLVDMFVVWEVYRIRKKMNKSVLAKQKV